VNTGYFLRFERDVKKLALAGKDGRQNVVWVEVMVRWRGPEFAQSIHGTAGIAVWRGKGASRPWEKVPTPSLSAEATIPMPDFKMTGKVSLNQSARVVLRPVVGDDALVDLIRDCRPYATEEEFAAKISAAVAKKGDAKKQELYAAKVKQILADKERVVLNEISE
jgi:hypothetical protein